MTNAPPRGSKDTNCPFFQKPQSEVCDTCALWQPWEVSDHQGKPVNEWKCAFAWLPAMTMNVAREVVGTQQATESFRNETIERQDQAQQRVAAHLRRLQQQGPPEIKTIEVPNGS